MNEADFEKELVTIKERWTALWKERAPIAEKRHELEKLSEKQLSLERELAELRGQEYATAWEWPAAPDGSRDEYSIICNHSTLLVYGAKSGLPEPKRSQTAVLRFDHSVATRMGTPNDEVIDGHHLYGKGLEMGGAFIIKRSGWIRELEKINSVHTCYSPEYWALLKHYFLFFEDSAFECVARNVESKIVCRDAWPMPWNPNELWKSLAPENQL